MNDADLARCLRAKSNASHREDSKTYVPDLSPVLAARDFKSARPEASGAAVVAHALSAEGFDASEDGTGRGTPLVPVSVSPGVGAIAVQLGGDRSERRADQQIVSTVQPPVMQVRRLTPVECERLQGFPDGYTAIERGGKLAADGPRYRALGNSMAVPVMRWIGKRIALLEDSTEEVEVDESFHPA